MLLLSLVLCSLLFHWIRADETVIVEIPQGKLLGVVATSAYHNQSYYSFKKIPYVKPNIGLNKFNPPEPAEPWEGILNATVYGEPCPFFNNIFETLEGEEDCLHVNVYTPSLDNNDTCKAVMVWIQGGGFNFGSANNDLYGPDYLIEYDVVIVVLNYRLGPIGFLSTGDKYLPGNLGLKDQVYALRWVRDNIEYFGGCPDKVTIFGQSAGAASAQYHLLSPMSKGLFRSTIQQSGSATDAWAFNYHPRESAFHLGRLLGIHTNDTKELVEKLKKLPASKIIKASTKTFEIEPGVPSSMIPFIPSVEPIIEGQEIFLEDNPMNLILSGQVHDVPMITGVTLDEGAFFLSNAANVTPVLVHKNTSVQSDFLIRDNMNITDPTEREKLRKDIYDFYFGTQDTSKLSNETMMDLLSDVLFINQYHLTSTIIKSQIKSPMYKYLLSYRSDDGIFRPVVQIGNYTAHGDDLEFVWYSELLSEAPKENSTTAKIYHLMLKMWTNFAKDGDPTSEMDDIVSEKWEPANENNNFLNINIPPKMENSFLPKRMSFWMDKYKHILGKYAKLF